jgi:hypothetical protein
VIRLARRPAELSITRSVKRGWGGCVDRAWLGRCATVVLVLALCGSALAIGPQPTPIPTPDGASVIYSPPQFNGWQLFAVSRRADGTLSVYCDPKHVYQDATLTGQLASGRELTKRYIEIYDELADGASSHGRTGFRDERRMTRFPVPEFDAAAGDDDRIEVFSNGIGNGGFLIVITKKGPR